MNELNNSINDSLSHSAQSVSGQALSPAVVAELRAASKRDPPEDVPPPAFRSAAMCRSFADIADKDIRRVAGYDADGRGRALPAVERAQLLAAYFASAVSIGEATRDQLPQFAGVFCMAARKPVSGSRAGWLRKVWSNFRAGRKPALLPDDKTRAAELVALLRKEPAHA